MIINISICLISFSHIDIKITYLYFNVFVLCRNNNNDGNRNKSVDFVKNKYFIYSHAVARCIIVQNKDSKLPGLLKHMYCLLCKKKERKKMKKII